MNIKLNLNGNQSYISNLAYIKALLIKYYIENMPISPKEKNEILISIMEYLKNN